MMPVPMHSRSLGSRRTAGVAVLTRRYSPAGLVASDCPTGQALSPDGHSCVDAATGDAIPADGGYADCVAAGGTECDRLRPGFTDPTSCPTGQTRSADGHECISADAVHTPADTTSTIAIANDAAKVGIAVGADIVSVINADNAAQLRLELAQIGLQADQIRANGTLNSQQSAERIAQLRAQADQAIQTAQQQTQRQIAALAAQTAASTGSTMLYLGGGALLLGAAWLLTRDKR